VSDEAEPDAPPPRYEWRDGWKYTINDEQEWLARPASWGIQQLPEIVQGRKQNLFDEYFYSWLAEFIKCDECRPLVRELFTEGGMHIPSALVVENADDRRCRDQSRARYSARHPNGACECAGLIRSVIYYQCGILTEPELRNRAIDEFYSLVHRLEHEGQTPRYRQAMQDKNRSLALELVGPNPFRPVTFCPEWRTDTAMSLARTMYDARDFSAMPILADALQDAGCDNAAILSHCRDPKQVHVRGCWVVDLVLGKP
jgi:hypothetical protein